MSRCGSCDLYWSEGKNDYGITCEGNLGVEDCAEKLQDLIFNLRSDLSKAKSKEETKV